MSSDRDQEIIQRRAGIPKAYRKTYDKAVKGKSLRAAVNAQCQECVFYQIDEIRNCSDLACPLYAVRPYQGISQDGHNEAFSSIESKNSEQKDIG
jgi:hypothetical protein